MSDTDRDYWLSLAVYDNFRGVPVRKVIARGYIDLRDLDRERQALFIRLGSLFFQGRSWRKFVGHDVRDPVERLSDDERAELARYLVLRRTIGAAFVRLLDDDETLDPLRRDTTVERLEAMGFIGPDYEI